MPPKISPPHSTSGLYPGRKFIFAVKFLAKFLFNAASSGIFALSFAAILFKSKPCSMSLSTTSKSSWPPVPRNFKSGAAILPISLNEIFSALPLSLIFSSSSSASSLNSAALVFKFKSLNFKISPSQSNGNLKLSGTLNLFLTILACCSDTTPLVLNSSSINTRPSSRPLASISSIKIFASGIKSSSLKAVKSVRKANGCTLPFTAPVPRPILNLEFAISKILFK